MISTTIIILANIANSSSTNLDFKMYLSTNREVFSISIVNRGSRPIAVGKPGTNVITYKVPTKIDHRKLKTRTDVGNSDPPFTSNMNDVIMLRPHSTLTGHIILSYLFNGLVPGNYKMNIRYDDDKLNAFFKDSGAVTRSFGGKSGVFQIQFTVLKSFIFRARSIKYFSKDFPKW